MGARARHERADKTESARQSLMLSGLPALEGPTLRTIF